jgi:hypothetical protein
MPSVCLRFARTRSNKVSKSWLQITTNIARDYNNIKFLTCATTTSKSQQDTLCSMRADTQDCRQCLAEHTSRAWQRLLPRFISRNLRPGFAGDSFVPVIRVCLQITSSDLLLSRVFCAGQDAAVLEGCPNQEGGRPYRPETCRSHSSTGWLRDARNTSQHV